MDTKKIVAEILFARGRMDNAKRLRGSLLRGELQTIIECLDRLIADLKKEAKP